MPVTDTRHESKTRLLQAALSVIRTKGYTATRIEDVCEAAGLTKGSFFHHFSTKEELAIAAADYWSEITSALFAQAPYHAPADPVDRILAYVDFRKALLQGELPEFTCLVGTMTQEVYGTHPAIREACEHSISGHASHAGARHSSCDRAMRDPSRLDRRKPRPVYTSRNSRGVHPCESPTGHCRCG
jgi:TetR/AcrR family transcriptional repressor of nem operon